MIFYFFGSGRDQKKICNSTRLLVNRRVIRSTTSVLLGTLSSWWVDCINKCQTESAGLSSKQIYCFWSMESVRASYGICIPWLEQLARWICNLYILISCDSKCLVFLAFFHFYISVNVISLRSCVKVVCVSVAIGKSIFLLDIMIWDWGKQFCFSNNPLYNNYHK